MTTPDSPSIIRPSFIQKCQQTITAHGMLRRGDAVLVGVSGGPDSMALLHLLLTLAAPMNLRLGIAHLNHCLRQSASDDDEGFVKSVAAKSRLPVFVEKTNILKQKKTGRSLEESGREARYLFFNSICRKHGFTKIAVGHHREDNAEQILLNLIRGSGAAGLCGIPPVRENIIRPLIQITPSEILDYLSQNNIEFMVDQSNSDTQFLRNSVRHQLLPLLRQNYNPNISEALNRLGGILRAEEEWLNALIDPLFNAALISSDDRQVILSVPEMMNFHDAAVRRVLRKAILTIKKDLRRITLAHIDSAARLIANHPPAARLDFPGQIRVLKNNDRLIVRKELKNLRIATAKAAKPVSFAYHASKDAIVAQTTLFIKEINMSVSFYQMSMDWIQNISTLERDTAFLDWDTLQFPLEIRNVRPGDRFSPIGMKGTQKLKKFFNANNIKPVKRTEIPIFVSGDAIIWIGGLRIADPFKVTQKTSTVLKVTISSSTHNRSCP